MLGGLLDHPVERKFRETAFFFRIAAADIGVHAGEPDLLDVLSDSRRVFVKRIGDEVLRLLPPVEPERATALVDRYTSEEAWQKLVVHLSKRGDRLTDRSRRILLRTQAATLYATKLSGS